MAFVHDDPHSQLNDLRTLVTVAVTLLSTCWSSVCLLLVTLLVVLLLSPCSCSSVCRLVAACGEQQPCPGCRAQSNL